MSTLREIKKTIPLCVMCKEKYQCVSYECCT